MIEKNVFSADRINRILIYSPNWIGDAVMAMPVLEELRQHYPKAQIWTLSIPWVKPIWEGNPQLDGVITYNPAGEWLSRELAGKFDLAVLLPNSFRSAWLTFMARIPLRIGYRQDGRAILLTHSIPQTPAAKKLHQVEYYLDILRHMGLDVPWVAPRLVTSPEEQAWIKDYLAGIGTPSGGWLAVHPGASKPQKRWHSHRFTEFADRLARKHDLGVLLLGSRGELGLLENIRQGMDKNLVCHIPSDLSLRQVMALIQCCRLFTGNDSGLMHIAAAVGAPVVGIFGPGTPQTTAPCTDPARYRTVLKDIPCRPCRQRFFKECKPSPSGKPPCVETISVADVFIAAEELLTLKR